MKKPEFLNYEPVYNEVTYENTPKVRGVFVSLVIAFVIWVLSAHFLVVLLAGLANVWVYLMDQRFLDLATFNACMDLYGPLLIFSLFIQFVARGTMYIAFIWARTYPSLMKVVMYSIFGRRVGSGNTTGRINRINIMGY